MCPLCHKELTKRYLHAHMTAQPWTRRYISILLPHMDPFQADNGLMAWKAVLRFDVFKSPASRTGKPSGPIVTGHPPEL